ERGTPARHVTSRVALTRTAGGRDRRDVVVSDGREFLVLNGSSRALRLECSGRCHKMAPTTKLSAPLKVRRADWPISETRHMSGDRHPTAVPSRPGIRIAACSRATVPDKRGARVNEREIAHHAHVHIVRAKAGQV